MALILSETTVTRSQPGRKAALFVTYLANAANKANCQTAKYPATEWTRI